MATQDLGQGTKSDEGQTFELLITAIASGDTAALLRLKHECGQFLFSVAQRYLNNHADADEAVGDVYSRIWLHAQRFDPLKGSARGWLATMCRNAAIDSIRRRHRLRDVDRAQWCVEFREDPGPEGIVDQWQMSQLMAAAIRRLPAAQRQMILLTFRDGLSHRQISKCHALPLGTVKSHISRSLKRLRRAMPIDRNESAHGPF